MEEPGLVSLEAVGFVDSLDGVELIGLGLASACDTGRMTMTSYKVKL